MATIPENTEVKVLSVIIDTYNEEERDIVGTDDFEERVLKGLETLAAQFRSGDSIVGGPIRLDHKMQFTEGSGDQISAYTLPDLTVLAFIVARPVEGVE